jgi:Adenylylsulphate kinase
MARLSLLSTGKPEFARATTRQGISRLRHAAQRQHAPLRAAERDRRRRTSPRAERRDPKGLYARARAGELQRLTGVDAPYEAPERPELTLHTTDGSGDDAVAAILDALRP